MKLSKSNIVSLVTGLCVFLTLYLSIIVKLNNDFDIKLVLAYLLISLFVSIVSLSLSKFKIKYAAEILLIVTIIAGLYLYISMPNTADGFSQLAVGLGWFMLMGISIAVLLVYLMITLLLRQYKKSV